MMKLPLKVRWLSKLREIGRRQTTGRLEDEYGQCCLGVGCEIAVEDGIIDAPIFREWANGLVYTWGELEPEVDEEEPYSCEEYETMPTPVWEYLGLEEANPSVNITMEQLERFEVDPVKAEYYRTHRANEDGSFHIDLASCNDDLHLNFEQIAELIENSDL